MINARHSGSSSPFIDRAVTIASCAVFDGAMGSAQFGGARSAAAAKAKLLGFMREQIEIGPAGAFAQCEDVGAIVRRLLDEMDPHEARFARLGSARLSFDA